MKRLLIFLSLAACALPTSVVRAAGALEPQVYRIAADADLQYRLQETLVKAVPGDVIEFETGYFQLARQIDIATDNITLRGQGPDKTILSFKHQLSGGQGIEAIGDNFVVEQLAIEDTAGNAIKVIGARNVTFREVRTEWTGEAQASNGAYGIYPVQCQNVLIDSCTAIGASDAGIYVGQSRNVVVRESRAERNVAGIEIENTINASVYNNVATNNASGLLIFDLPGLQVKNGRNVRAFSNQVIANNHPNFAAPGNIVATVPSGTGVMIMATDYVELFDNDLKDNQTASIAMISYLTSGKKNKDPEYDPISEAISIHDNRISGGGTSPAGQLSTMLIPVLGATFPDILFDGVYAQQKLVNGKLPDELRHSIVNNGDATFVDFNLPQLSAANLLKGKYQVSRDLSPFERPRAPLEDVELTEHDPPSKTADTAVLVYRSAPKLLSEYGLFEGNGSTQEPAAGVVPYSLNTTLFTDYATKYRFIRIPNGAKIDYAEAGLLGFPEGTLIAKTFAYPVDATDPTQGEQLLETRIEELRDGEWYGYSYRWNEAQTDATLTLGGGELEVSWIHQDGTQRTNHYEIPNPNQCLNCHAQSKSYQPIGPTAKNMNRDFEFATGNSNQLEFLAAINWLEKLPKEDERQRMPVAFDPATGSLDERAHAWLDVNCAHCHNPGGTARTSGLDLRYSQTDPTKFGVWKAPVAAGHGSGGLNYDIVPGQPSKSILLYRMESDDPSIRMANVGRNLIHTEGVELIREWIASMPKEEK